MATKLQKSSKQRHDTAVQGTNDSSIVSKCSAANLGYFNDKFLQYFVAKQVRRSPLLNRGYYIRAKAIQRVFNNFLANQETKKQIISLGCGFDSSYWRLKDSEKLKNVTFLEIDFLDVAERKASLVNSKPVLSGMIDKIEDGTNNANIILNARDYKLLGVDLSDLKLLQTTLESCSVDFDAPSLLLSEVALTYMAPKYVDKLINWAASSFPNGMFVTYEQILPHDPFGVVMLKHFKKIGSELRNINVYPTINEQIQRYLNKGWDSCNAVDANQFFVMLPETERSRMFKLEPFDEFEEWHCKCAHYILLVAMNGECLPIYRSIFQLGEMNSSKDDQKENCKIDHKISQKEEMIKVQSASSQLNVTFNKRFGHCCTTVNDDFLLVLGGFGEELGIHKRITYPLLLFKNENTDGTWEVTCINSTQDIPAVKSEVMHSTVTYVEDGKSVVFGGRLSPKCCNNTVIKIDTSHTVAALQNNTGSGPVCSDTITDEKDGTAHNEKKNKVMKLNFDSKEIETVGDVPAPRWRHSATLVLSSGKKCIVIFGGRNANCCFGDSFMLNLQTFTWKKLNFTGDIPNARHSHSADFWKDKLVVAGGLNSKENIEKNVLMLDLATLKSSEISLQGEFIPRYSHTSGIVNDQLLLVGGVTVSPEITPGVAVINLYTGLVQEYSLPGADPEGPLMLHNHSSVMIKEGVFLVIGGGGNCFSFGTHLNGQPFIVDCTACLS